MCMNWVIAIIKGNALKEDCSVIKKVIKALHLILHLALCG